MMGKVIMSGIVPNMTVPVTGIKASDIAVGSIVKLMEDGVATEYLVVNQGIPSGSSLYDASCDGMWLLRKDIKEKRQWDADNSTVLETSDIQTWLNSDMLAKFDSVTKSAIKPVKIPYRSGGPSGTNQSGANGLSCKVFLLSVHEVGWNFSSSNISYPVDGAKLEYFESGTNTSADNKRIAYLDGIATVWWFRSMFTSQEGAVFGSLPGGDVNALGANYSWGVRPALILPSTALFDETTMLLKGVA